MRHGQARGTVMRNPSRKVGVFAALAACGGAAAWLGVQLSDVFGQAWVSGMLFTVGLTIAFITLVLLIQALVLAGGAAKLRSGIGRVAQWQVSAAEWDKFRAAESGR